MAAPTFGKVQLMIMEVLWERGEVSAREITDALNESDPIAHSTVQTLLRKLEAKGAVTHREEDRTFLFRALTQPEKVRKSATRDFVERMFAGSSSGLIAHLLKHERLSKSELEELRNLIREKGE